jgi:hypothetical protein
LTRTQWSFTTGLDSVYAAAARPMTSASDGTTTTATVSGPAAHAATPDAAL